MTRRALISASSLASRALVGTPRQYPQFSRRCITQTQHQLAAVSNDPVPQPKWSTDKDREESEPKLPGLLKSGGGRWTLTADGKALEGTLKFQSFKKAWEFMNDVAFYIKTEKHHPEWSNMYNTVFLRWTTHNPEGLSSKDVSLAAFCDLLAKDERSGVIKSAESSAPKLSSLADKAVEQTGDCCTPKEK